MAGFESLRAADYSLDATLDGQTVLVGNGDTFTDSGGIGAFYQNNEDYTVTFEAPPGLNLSVTFNSFYIEENFDFFYIFDGPDINSPAVGSPGGFTGSANIGTVVASGNSLTFRMVSDFIVPASGWDATISVSGGATLGNAVWIDTDANGSYDPGESGLDGVLLELVDANGVAVDNPNVGGFQAYSVISDPMGSYSFSNVPAGSYKVKIATPKGSDGISSPVTDTADNQEDDDDNGIQAIDGGEVLSPLITLASGETDNTVDFGFVPSQTNTYTFNASPGFDWFDGSSGVVWASTDTSKTHDISYTDSFGNPQTVTVTMSIIDPDNRNGDSAADLHSSATHPFDPSGGAAPYPGSAETDLVPGNGSIDDPWDSDLDPVLTETGGEFGSGFLTMGIKTGDSQERVGYRFEFSKPVELSNLEVSAIDSIGVNFSSGLSEYETVGNSYQDRVEFFGRNGDEPVALLISSGAELTAVAGTVYHSYDSAVSGTLLATDPLGTTTVASDGGITVLEIYYSNGSDDAVNEKEQPSLYSYWSGSNGATAGASDDQSIRISGFDLIVADDAKVSGRVLADTDGDGSGDSGISGVELTLYSDPNGNGDYTAGAPIDNPNLVGTQDYVVSTLGDGSYLFSGLAAGDYVVVESQPSGYRSLSDGDVTSGGDDVVNTSVSDNAIPVTLEVSEEDNGNEFVEVIPGSLSGSVTADIDNDGEGEVGIENVVLTLKDSSGNDVDSDDLAGGIQPTTTLTNGVGDYLFSNLIPGDYRVLQTQPAGYASVSDADEGDPDQIGNESEIEVNSGLENSGNDFVEEEFGAISGAVLADTNNDNVGDLAISGVLLTLKDDFGDDIDSDPIAGGVQPTTTTTDENGDYRFVNLATGFYRVFQTQPIGFVSVSDTDGADNNLIGDETDLFVSAGEEDSGHVFVEVEPGAISGSVLADTNNDDVGELALVGVVLTLKDGLGADIDSDPLALGVQPTTVSTDLNGDYEFEVVLPGSYWVEQSQPVGYLSVSDSDGLNNNIIGDESAIVVSAGIEAAGNLFVEEQPGSIAGLVQLDTDNDGNGEVGFGGVTLVLKDSSGDDIDSDAVAAGIQPTTTLTSDGTMDVDGDSSADPVGEFYFGEVRPGSYQVAQIQPPGFDSVSDSDGENNDVVGDETELLVVPGGTVANVNFVDKEGKAGTFSEWQSQYALELGGQNGAGDNPDGDIYPNALEYAFCLNPVGGLESNNQFHLTKDALTGEVVVEFVRPIGSSDLVYELEGADTLATPTIWTSITSVAPTLDSGASGLPPGAEKVTYSGLESASELTDGSAKGVVRLKVTLAGQEYFTDVFGWQCVDYNDYQLATFSSPFSNAPVFSGTFASTGTLTTGTDGSGNVTLDVSDSAFGQDLSSTVGTAGEFYLQLTSGVLEGERFDILEGGIDALTLINDPGIFSESDGVDSLNTKDGIPPDSQLNGASYEVIRHQTIGEVFSRTTTYAGEEDNNPGDATRLLFYNQRRDNPGFDVFILIGTSSANSKWIYSNDLLSQFDQENLRLDPCGGNWIHPRSSGDSENPSLIPPVRQFSFGLVADHDQSCAMNEGYNLLGAMWPIDQSPAGANGRNLKVSAGFDGGIAPADASELLFWDGDLVVDDDSVSTYNGTYTNYMLLDGGGMQNWVDINDLVLTNQDAILVMESHRATLLKLLTGDQKKSHLYPQPAF